MPRSIDRRLSHLEAQAAHRGGLVVVAVPASASAVQRGALVYAALQGAGIARDAAAVVVIRKFSDPAWCP